MLLLWVGAISLFYHQWGKINGLGLHQLDYVHANLEASPAKVLHKNSLSPAATCVGSSSESGDNNVIVSKKVFTILTDLGNIAISLSNFFEVSTLLLRIINNRGSYSYDVTEKTLMH